MSSLLPAGIGGVAGFGCFVVTRSFRRPELAAAIGRLGRNPSVVPGASQPLVNAFGAERLAVWITGRFKESRHQDLAVLDRDALAHGVRKVMGALCGVGTALVLAVLTAVAGAAGPLPTLFLIVIGGVGGFLLPDRQLQAAARNRRTDAVAALSAYLDLVNVLLAGGAGLETALHAAAESGDGWAFEQLRAMLTRARSRRQSVWVCCADLGRRVGIQELVELSASVQLAGQQGARIAQSLSARAQSLRVHVLADIEEQAQSASERMGLPTVLLFVGFLFLLGYPAAQIILGSS
jgi:hypothetical protein